MFWQLLQGEREVNLCQPHQSGEFWQKWEAALGQELQAGVLLSNQSLFLADHPHLERWVFAPVRLAAAQPQTFEFVPFNAEDATERWAMILTEKWQLCLVSRGDQALFSFHPQISKLVLDILLTQPQTEKLQTKLQSLTFQLPEYGVMANMMATFLSLCHPREVVLPELADIDILQSMIHEVRTPLTTIRTLVSSLLKRSDINPLVRQRLEQIERETKMQIDRLNLIFQIVDHAQPLLQEPLQLEELVLEELPQWQWQTDRRNLTLEYIPSQTSLPPVLTNRELLQQLLNGLIDRLLRLLPSESKIKVQLHPAGSYLKLEIITSSHTSGGLQPIGRWLAWQPETGVVSLSLVVTKALFQALGGKFTLKTLPTEEIIVVYLPVLPG
ncbi:MAG: histidine kinase dimerization/phospho-acceptor domain-containing protein [Pseudanabaenaceae cyanobacterium]